MKKYVIIVAGGKGNRMNAGVPKQFIQLAGKPVLMHTLQRFYNADPSIKIIVVISKEEFDSWKKICHQYDFRIDHKLCEGGETRFHSVSNGLKAVKEKSIVAIHDGARPFVSNELINKCFIAAEQYGNAVPAIPLYESMRKVEGGHTEMADRNSFVVVQTPQCFESDVLKEAYSVEFKNHFTDDASVVEHFGKTIHLIDGERENIKITFPFDLIVGESILKKYFTG